MEQDNLIKNQNLFPRTTDIPQTVLKDIPCIQTGYLVDGEIQVWDGPRQEVLSPVWVVGSMDLKPFFIGEYPLLTEAEALQALDAAVAAYDPCTYLALSENSMAERVKQAVIELKGVGTTLFNV